jgi:hypothetical protein
VFCFKHIRLDSNVTVNVVGNMGLALLAQREIHIASTISVDGTAGADYVYNPSAGGPGGPGAEGSSGTESNSAPPPADAGNGGGGYGWDTNTRSGIGLGRAWTVNDIRCSGPGGGYGGTGGPPYVVDWEAGTYHTGGEYGTASLTNLYGGSGGAGGHSKNNKEFSGGGGGGGGALALVAGRTIAFAATGRLSAQGGRGGHTGTTSAGLRFGGGGGSGGGILVAANTVTFAVTDGSVTNLTVRGGNGGDSQVTDDNEGSSGSGGGGGRVAIYSSSDFTDSPPGYRTAPAFIDIGPGLAGTVEPVGNSGSDGNAGTFYRGELPGFLTVRDGAVLRVR